MTEKTAPTTFEPDWEKIANVYWDSGQNLESPAAWKFRTIADPRLRDRIIQRTKDAIIEYQRQMAEASYVVVRREDLGEAKEIAHNCLILPGNPWFVEVGKSIIGHIDDALGR